MPSTPSAAPSTARSPPPHVSPRHSAPGAAGAAAASSEQPPALGLGLEPPPPPPVGRDHPPDQAASFTAGLLPLLRLRAIAKQSLCWCLERLGMRDEALAEANASHELATLARTGGGVAHVPAHVDEALIDVRLPSTTGALFMCACRGCQLCEITTRTPDEDVCHCGRSSIAPRLRSPQCHGCHSLPLLTLAPPVLCPRSRYDDPGPVPVRWDEGRPPRKAPRPQSARSLVAYSPPVGAPYRPTDQIGRPWRPAGISFKAAEVGARRSTYTHS